METGEVLPEVGGGVLHAAPLLPGGPGAPEWPASLGMRSRTPGLSALRLPVNARTLAKRLKIGSVPFQLDCLSERTNSKENSRSRTTQVGGWGADWSQAGSPHQLPSPGGQPHPEQEETKD